MLSQRYIDLCEEHELYERRDTPLVFTAFSGGADSTALAVAFPNSIPVFTDTGWEFPELYEQIEKFERITGRRIIKITPSESLPDYIHRTKYLPGFGSRFCTRIYKIEALNKRLGRFAKYYKVILCVGLRADEPPAQRVGNLTNMPNLSIRYPLREAGIDKAGVDRICEKHRLMPQYPVYMLRGGCMGCYQKRKSEVKAMAVLCPEILDKLQALEEAIQDERGKFAVMFSGIKFAGKQMSIREIRRQPTLFDLKPYYTDAATMNSPCGIFCNR